MLTIMSVTDEEGTKHFQVFGAGAGEMLPSVPSADGADCHILVQDGLVKVEGRYPYERLIIITPADNIVYHDVFEVDGEVDPLGQMRVFDATLAYAAKVIDARSSQGGEIIAWSNIADQAEQPRYYKVSAANYSDLF